ncbi:MAG: tetratricopeptide repeat protein [Desulfobacterales bacterium]|nr:MAG: tetratricopeptide repeat protein [Desulfobacterales bacterium]
MTMNEPQKPIYRNYTDKADALYQQGRCDAAVDLLLNTAARHPRDPNLYYRFAELLIDSQQYQDALDVLAKMPAKDKPNKAGISDGQKTVEDARPSPDVKKMELVGYCKQGLGQGREALKVADRLLALKPDSASAMNLKALAVFRNGDLKGARDCFEKAIALDPDFAEAYTHLGNLRQEISQQKEALDLYEKGFILAPTVSHIVLAYHSAVVAQKAFFRAEPLFRKAKDRYPLNKRIRYLLIDLLIQQTKYEAAMREIEAAIVKFGIDDGILPAALKIRSYLGPIGIQAQPKNKASVSLCMIAKNEERHLARCLQSAKPLVDEIIVVDTGSTDRTRDIARAFGADVYATVWQEDFSKARNISLSKASGHWIFILDADEVIAPVDYEGFRKLISSAPDRQVAFSIETRNYTALANTVGWNANSGRYAHEEAGTGWFPSVKVRLFPNHPNIRFEYPVHEMVDPWLKRMGIRIETADIPVHHYGKLNQQNQAGKGQTYYDIGIKKLAEMGDNISALRELAVQAGNLGKWEEAIQLWHRLIRLQGDSPEAFVNMGTAHWQLGQYEKALWCNHKALSLQPDLKEAHFNYALNLLHLRDAEKAIPVLENLLEEHPQYIAARFMLTAAYCCAGNKASALDGCRQIQRTEIGPVLAVSFHDLAKTLIDANAIDYAIALLETAVECGSADENVRNFLISCRQKVSESQP